MPVGEYPSERIAIRAIQEIGLGPLPGEWANIGSKVDAYLARGGGGG